jgi:hypothetical protein
MDIKLTQQEIEYLDFLQKNFNARNTLFNLMNGGIAINWGTDDVIHQAEQLACWCNTSDPERAIKYRQLDEDDAKEILDDLDQNHDANIGICWDTIDIYIDEYLNI